MNNWDKNTPEVKIFYSLYSRIIVENWLFEFIKKQKREGFIMKSYQIKQRH